MILRVTSGPLEGKIFQIEENIILGRSTGNILLKDPKVSNPHAQIHKSNDQYILKDLSSKRGIYYQDGTVAHLILQPGVAFQLGSTIFQVDEKPSEQHFPSVAGQELKGEAGEDLKTQLIKQLEFSLNVVKDQNRSLNFLKNPICLQFEKGVQKGTCWNVSYLPRKVGSIEADLPLIDPQAPKVSFELFLEKENIMFSTCHTDVVLLNYRQVQKEQLKHGDLIVVGSAYIRVSLS